MSITPQNDRPEDQPDPSPEPGDPPKLPLVSKEEMVRDMIIRYQVGELGPTNLDDATPEVQDLVVPRVIDFMKSFREVTREELASRPVPIIEKMVEKIAQMWSDNEEANKLIVARCCDIAFLIRVVPRDASGSH